MRQLAVKARRMDLRSLSMIAVCFALMACAGRDALETAAWVGYTEPPQQPPQQQEEFGPRKRYRECLNRNFAFRAAREHEAASPDAIAEEALLDCHAEEGALTMFVHDLMPALRARAKAWLVSSGQIPENM
jgi:hypothetical protein